MLRNRYSSVNMCDNLFLYNKWFGEASTIVSLGHIKNYYKIWAT